MLRNLSVASTCRDDILMSIKGVVQVRKVLGLDNRVIVKKVNNLNGLRGRVDTNITLKGQTRPR
jgi:hypothetical protein